MEPGGEDIAYLAGDIGEELVEDVAMFICNCHCHENDIENIIHQQNKINKYGNESRFEERGCPYCDGAH